MSIIQAFQTLDRIEGESSKNAKKDILAANMSNEALNSMLHWTFNDFISFHVDQILRPFVDQESNYGDLDESVASRHFAQFQKLGEDLLNRKMTGNEAAQATLRFFETLCAVEKKWWSRVLAKDLRIGMSVKSINEVLIDHPVPVFDCMLAKPYEKVGKKPDFVIIEPKEDGYRLFALRQGDDVTLYTRNGRIVQGFDALEQELLRLPSGYVYDGELINDKFSDMQKIVFAHTTGKTATYRIFDVIPDDEFFRGASTHTLLQRKQTLQAYMAQQTWSTLSLVEWSEPVAIDSAEMNHYYEEYVQQGYEGIMVKNVQGKYTCKRSSDWMKMKPSDTYDLPIVAVEEGTGKNKNATGAFVVQFEGNTVNVGSGLSDEQRILYWEQRDALIGRVIEIKAQEVTTDRHGVHSLRFPTFVRLREDK